MLIDINKTSSKNIFCYINGKHHFDLLYSIVAQNQDINFFVFSPNINLDDFIQSQLYSLNNITLIKNNEAEINELIFKIKAFGLMVTTDAQATSAHKKSLQFVNFFQKNKVKVLELQHGLFQLGLHYSSKPNKDAFKSDCLPLASYADYVLTYYPTLLPNEIVIGYPLYNKKNMPNIKGEYTLILSNLHWNIYTDSQRNLFYTSVIQLIKNNPNTLFIWKMHHGEIAQLNKVKEILNTWGEMKKNIIFTNEDSLFKYTSTSDLIKNSKNVISTVSTVLLECEMHHKPTIIFETQNIKCLVDKIQRKTTFQNYQELKEAYNSKHLNLRTGHLIQYNNSIFRDTINKLYKEPNTANILDNIMSFSNSIIY